MDGQVRIEPLAALAGYVALSSLAGLARAAFETGAGLFDFVWNVWSGSAFADLVFVGGTCATGWLAYSLARDRRWAASLAVGFLGTWATYAASFLALTGSPRAGFGMDPGGVPWFVLEWGILGILAGTVLPAAAALPPPEDSSPAPRRVVLGEVLEPVEPRHP